MSPNPLKTPPLLTSQARRARTRARIDRAGVVVGMLLLLPATAEADRSGSAAQVDEISHSIDTSIRTGGTVLSVEAVPVEELELRTESGAAWRPGTKPLPTFRIRAPAAPDLRVRERSEGAASPFAVRVHRSVGVLPDCALAPPPAD